jgi:antibiotic biosynthesis monooxygenase (ABM) superfamily enzyme
MHEEIVELVPKRVIGPMRTEYLTGLETWFTLPTDPGAPAPPRYKMALLTWITIFPLIAASPSCSARSSKTSRWCHGSRSRRRSPCR